LTAPISSITGGRERWLYKVARKHAGGAGDEGFAISMPTLFEKSGAEGEYRRFKFEIVKLAEKNALPGYTLTIEPGKMASRCCVPRVPMARMEAAARHPILATATVSPGNILLLRFRRPLPQLSGLLRHR
jgi:plasmid replication initiation protein